MVQMQMVYGKNAWAKKAATYLDYNETKMKQNADYLIIHF